MKHKSSHFIFAFIIGGIAGGVTALLCTPYDGKEFRERINSTTGDYLRIAKQKKDELLSKTKSTADDLITKSIRLSALAEKYAGEICEESRGKLELEKSSIKAAAKAAVETYKNGKNNSTKSKLASELAENFFSDYDNVVLPKTK
jgi:gas vesicle protein